MDNENEEKIKENNIKHAISEENKILKEQKRMKNSNEGLKILLNLYNLNIFLKKQINESIKLKHDSSFQKNEFYLIREDYISKFLKINSYDEIYQILNNKQENNVNNISEIFLNLIQIYETNFFEKMNFLENFKLNNENLFNIEYRANNEIMIPEV